MVSEQRLSTFYNYLRCWKNTEIDLKRHTVAAIFLVKRPHVVVIVSLFFVSVLFAYVLSNRAGGQFGSVLIWRSIEVIFAENWAQKTVRF